MYSIRSVPSSCTTGKQGSLTPSGKVVGGEGFVGLGGEAFVGLGTHNPST